jgi:hypothetical protein
MLRKIFIIQSAALLLALTELAHGADWGRPVRSPDEFFGAWVVDEEWQMKHVPYKYCPIRNLSLQKSRGAARIRLYAAVSSKQVSGVMDVHPVWGELQLVKPNGNRWRDTFNEYSPLGWATPRVKTSIPRNHPLPIIISGHIPDGGAVIPIFQLPKGRLRVVVTSWDLHLKTINPKKRKQIKPEQLEQDPWPAAAMFILKRADLTDTKTYRAFLSMESHLLFRKHWGEHFPKIWGEKYYYFDRLSVIEPKTLFPQ